MPGKSSSSPLIPAIIVSLLIGGVGGYAAQHFRAASGAHASAASTGSGSSGTAPPEIVLVRLVRNLFIMERVQKQGLTPQQVQTLLPILKAIQSADPLPVAESQAKIDTIEKALTASQKQALDVFQQRIGGTSKPDPEHMFALEYNKKMLADFIASLGSASKK